jgi:hypothetical protein
MQEFALWGLTVSAILVALCSVIIQSHADPELQRVVKAAMSRRGAPVRRAGFVTLTLGFGNAILFTLLAIGMSDWRFAAIYWVPFVAGWLARMTNATSGRGAQR